MKSSEMSEKQLQALLIDNYTNLQRIKNADDKEKEIDYQIKTTKAKLEVLGVDIVGLDIL